MQDGIDVALIRIQLAWLLKSSNNLLFNCTIQVHELFHLDKCKVKKSGVMCSSLL